MNSRLTALILLVAVVVFRVGTGFASPSVAGFLTGFGPFSAMVLGAAVLIPGARHAWLPAAMFLVSDLILNVFVFNVAAFQPYILVSMAFYAVLFLLGGRLSGRGSLAMPFLGTTAAAVVLFHLVTNTVSWVVDPGYAKTMGGLIQAHTTGLPGYPSTLVFLAKALAGNMAFAGLFLFAMAPARQSAPATTAARA